MKRSFIAIGLMLTVSVLTNCSKDETATAPDTQREFTIEAAYTPITSDTRTILDPETGKVTWDGTDNLSVFVVEAGNTPTSWTNNKFTVKDAEQGTFVSSDVSIDPTKTYDWYIMSPYSSYVNNPVGATGSTFQIGNQTQDNAAPTAHLTNVDLMTGVVKNVPGTQKPVVTLNHRATLMKFTIVNKETTAITPTQVAFESTAVVGGRFSIDFATGALTGTNNWTTTTLTIKNAPAIEPDGSYDVYMMMPPFSLAIGDTFTIKVTADNGFSEQTRTMSRQLTFEAGKMNSATINYVTAKPEPITGDWSTTLKESILGVSGNNSEIYSEVALNKLFWNTSYVWGNGTNTYIGGSQANGAQIGSASNYCRKAVFSTAYYVSPVTSVTVNARGVTAVDTAENASISVTVNGVAYTTTDNPITKTLKDFVFSVPENGIAQTGDIVITIENPTAKGALYIKEISIATN